MPFAEEREEWRKMGPHGACCLYFLFSQMILSLVLAIGIFACGVWITVELRSCSECYFAHTASDGWCKHVIYPRDPRGSKYELVSLQVTQQSFGNEWVDISGEQALQVGKSPGGVHVSGPQQSISFVKTDKPLLSVESGTTISLGMPTGVQVDGMKILATSEDTECPLVMEPAGSGLYDLKVARAGGLHRLDFPECDAANSPRLWSLDEASVPTPVGTKLLLSVVMWVVIKIAAFGWNALRLTGNMGKDSETQRPIDDGGVLFSVLEFFWLSQTANVLLLPFQGMQVHEECAHVLQMSYDDGWLKWFNYGGAALMLALLFIGVSTICWRFSVTRLFKEWFSFATQNTSGGHPFFVILQLAVITILLGLGFLVVAGTVFQVQEVMRKNFFAIINLNLNFTFDVTWPEFAISGYISALRIMAFLLVLMELVNSVIAGIVKKVKQEGLKLVPPACYEFRHFGNKKMIKNAVLYLDGQDIQYGKGTGRWSSNGTDFATRWGAPPDQIWAARFTSEGAYCCTIDIEWDCVTEHDVTSSLDKRAAAGGVGETWVDSQRQDSAQSMISRMLGGKS